VVNIRGYFFMSVEAGKLMRDNGGGSIINVASINGISPGIFQGIYSVTKAAVIKMTKVFAKECAQFGIRCNAFVAGFDRYLGCIGAGEERCDLEYCVGAGSAQAGGGSE
jgi:NAD(P)-dependent dehydrogenase (short-subunit alcohol dehydrogenase family)